MANEGIMSLPGGMGMPAAQPAEQQTPTVTSADSYDAAQTALGMVNPGDQAAAKDAIRQAIGDLQLAPEQIDLLIQIFEYVSQNPGDYKNLIQKMIEAGAVDPGEFPEEYDPQFIGMVLMVLHEMQQMQGQGAMEPMNLSPIVEGLQPAQMAEGGLADVASYLASQGRGGDSILAHITPEEAAMLKRRGGSGTINPMTGLPEFKGGVIGKVVGAVKSVVKGVVGVVKKALQSPVGKILGTIALATVLGPAGVGLSMGTAAGVASAGTTLLAGGSIKDALVSGALGYVGGGGTIMGVNPVSAVGQYLPGAAGGALNTGLATGLMGAGIGKLAGMSTADALKMGLTTGATAGALKALQPGAAPGTEGAPAEGGAPVDQGIGGLKTAADATGVGAPGQIGTAQDLLGGGMRPGALGPSMQYDPMTGSYKVDYSVTPAASAGGGAPGLRMPAPGSMNGVGMDGMGSGISGVNLGSTARDFGVAAGGTGVQTNYSLTPAPVTPAAAQPTGFMDTMVQGAKNLYNEYLSPSRPGLPADAGILTKYGPLAAAGTAAVAAMGGMEGEPANQNPLFNRAYTGMDYLKDNPDKFQGGLDFGYTRPSTPRSPVVQTDFSSQSPTTQAPSVVPMGATMSPGGVAQPYNVAGLYGVPLIYPVGRARGGEMSMTKFPRRNGPISGPGTGTSDDIPAMLSDGEFVFTAKAVRNAGGGSRRKGAARMYKLMKKLEGGPVKG